MCEGRLAALRLSSFEALENAERQKCLSCAKSRRYVCAPCGVLLVSGPRVRLPLRFEILQVPREARRSTAGQAAALSPDVRVWRDRDAFDREILGRRQSQRLALLYPRDDAVAISEANDIDALVVIDAPWTAAAVMAEEMRHLRCVKLNGERRSVFWRYAPIRGDHSQFNRHTVPDCLSTVEAIHQSCVQRNAAAVYDDLLWLFAFQHRTVSAALTNDANRMQRVVQKSKGVLEGRFAKSLQ